MFSEGGNEGWERFRKRQGKTLRKVLSKARKLEKNKSKQVKRFGNVEVEEGMGAAYMPKAGTQGVPEREVTSKAVKKQLNRNRNRAQMKGDLETPSIRYTHSRDKSTDYIRPVKKKRIHKKKVKEEVMIEGSKPNNPKLWAAKKAAAKAKFDVYPSAYANGWAAKAYKKAGGTWRSESVEHDLNELSGKTLSNYIQKSANPVKKNSAVNLASRGGYKLGSSAPHDLDAGEKEDRKAYNRGQGMQRAAIKLQKKMYGKKTDRMSQHASESVVDKYKKLKKGAKKVANVLNKMNQASYSNVKKMKREENNPVMEAMKNVYGEAWFDTASYPTHKDHRKQTADRKTADALNSPNTLKKRQQMHPAHRKAYDAKVRQNNYEKHGVGSKKETTPRDKKLWHPDVKAP